MDHIIYQPNSPSGRYVSTGGFPSPPKQLQIPNNELLSPTFGSTNKAGIKSALDMQRLLSLQYSEKAAAFEMKFPTDIVLNDDEINKFKQEDIAEKRIWFSQAGKEEEKAVTAAKVLLEKESPVTKPSFNLEVCVCNHYDARDVICYTCCRSVPCSPCIRSTPPWRSGT